MADPARKPNYNIDPNIRPDLRAINGGGQTSPRQGKLSALDKLENSPESSPTGSVADREGRGSNVIQGPWATKLDAAKNISAVGTGGKPNKSKSPLIAILIIIFGGGFSFAGLFGAFSLLPIDIVAQFVSKYDTQNTSWTIRADKLINAKISKGTTAGSCNVINIVCRYTRPSNKLLAALSDEGVQAFNGDTPINAKKGLLKSPFPGARPDHYKFTDSTGTVHDIKASDFSKTLSSNAEFRAAFHKAYTPKAIGFLDNVFKKIKLRFGFKTSDSLKGSKGTTDANKTINETTKGPETGASKAVGADATAVVEKKLTNTIKKTGNKVAESGKGNVIGLVAGIVCAVGDIPSITIATVRAYQMGQLILYGATILTAIGAMKAGDAKPAEVSAIGSLFTQVVKGKSAMDSFGMKYTLFGDTKPASKNYLKFVPGGSAALSLNGVAKFTGSLAKKDVCSVATNPATGLIIDGATSGTLVLPLLNLAAGFALSEIMTKVVIPFVLPGIIKMIPIKDILKFFVGDLTQNLQGEDVGDAFTSAASNLMGQTANAGGNMPLSVPDAVAYGNVTQQVNLAYAQEDRATHSPLDATNPNTMLGSLVSQLVPYYSQLGSVSGIVSTIGSIVTSSISRLTNTYAATPSSSQYTMCQDPAIQNQVAAGPFCNIIYGIPPKYLNKDPQTVLNDLIASKDINPQTGEPKDKGNAVTNVFKNTEAPGSLKDWLALCSDGTATEAANCQVTNDQTADYALYTIDHRVQQTMDGEDTSLNPQTGTTSASTATPTATSTSTTTTNTSPSAYINPTNTNSINNDGLFAVLNLWLPPKRLEGAVL